MILFHFTHKYATFLFVTFFSIAFANAQPYWQQKVKYAISTELDTANHKLICDQTIFYKNNSPDTLTNLYLHVFPNAFKKNSIMDREAQKLSINLVPSEADSGGINIHSLLIARSFKFDKIEKYTWRVDDTILRIDLYDKLLPRDSIYLEIDYEVIIRKMISNAGNGGYFNTFYEISQWYPKICVYDNKGWHSNPYHYFGEYYGEFADYSVKIKAPQNYTIVGLGNITSGDPGWESNTPKNRATDPLNDKPKLNRREITFEIENVHDFIWLASPDFKYIHGQWNNIAIKIFYRGDLKSAGQWEKYTLDYAKKALEWWDNIIGDFPYDNLIICQGLTNGGMEYPTLSLLGNLNLLLLVHEIGHNYFQSALANDELNEGWFDEGIITFLTEEYERLQLGRDNRKMLPHTSIPYLKKQFNNFSTMSNYDRNSLNYFLYSGFDKPLSFPVYKLDDLYSYSYNVYVKPKHFFEMLDFYLGRDVFLECIRKFYLEWKFKHVKSCDFRIVCEQVSGKKLDWFFKQWIYDTPDVDYGLKRFNSTKLNSNQWDTEFIVKRYGDGIMPITAELLLASGKKINYPIDFFQKESKISLNTNEKVIDIRLDPEDKIIDINRSNNSLPKYHILLFPDFPSMYYLSRDSYSFFYWPRAWYNDIDGVKAGLKLYGSYLNRYNVTRNLFWYNTKSHTIDFKVNYSSPCEKINKNLWTHFSFTRMEGRKEFNANLNYNHYKIFNQSPNYILRLGFLHHDVYDPKYTIQKYRIGKEIKSVEIWQDSRVNNIFMNFQIKNKIGVLNSELILSTYFSNKRWDSEYNNSRLSFEYNLYKNNPFKCQFYIRLFGGYASEKLEDTPYQELFWVAQANPTQIFKYYYLRSPGSVPTALPYHLPGDGNLRGYINSLVGNDMPLAANRLITANIQYTYPNMLHNISFFYKYTKTRVDLSIFADGGKIWNHHISQNFLADFGFGLQFNRQILDKMQRLRIDFPVWVSQPELEGYNKGDKQWDFRWLISLQEAF